MLEIYEYICSKRKDNSNHSIFWNIIFRKLSLIYWGMNVDMYLLLYSAGKKFKTAC